jgi:hypothetical protein
MNNSNVRFYQLIPPQAAVAASTAIPTGAAVTGQTYGTTVDTAGYSYLQVVLQIGANSGGSFSALQMQESDTATSGFASYAAQGAGLVQPCVFGTSSALALTTYANSAEGSYYTPVVSTLPSAANVIELFNIDLKGRKRWQQLSATTGSAGNTYVSALAILSRVEVSPKTASQYGADQTLSSPAVSY